MDSRRALIPALGKTRICRSFADVAQLVEHFTRNEGVPGSSPGVGSPALQAPCARRPLRSCTRVPDMSRKPARTGLGPSAWACNAIEPRWTVVSMKKLAALLTLVSAALVMAAPTASAADGGGVFSSVISVDRAHRTATLPLFAGRTAAGDATYYIVTESSDKADAQRRGVNYAPKLRKALGTKAVQTVTDDGGTLVFPGTVDFGANVLKPNRKTGFPPVKAVPGAVGDATYSPLITTGDGIVLNAPQVANTTGQADTATAIDKAAGRVTEALFKGFVGGTPNY